MKTPALRSKVKLRINIGCSVIEKVCIVTKHWPSGAYRLLSKGEFEQEYHIRKGNLIRLNEDSDVIRKVSVVPV